MQYILSQEEYEALKNGAKIARELYMGVIEELCQKVCDHMPVVDTDNSIRKIPWGCIKSKNKGNMGHCGSCPVVKTCTYDRKYFCK